MPAPKILSAVQCSKRYTQALQPRFQKAQNAGGRKSQERPRARAFRCGPPPQDVNKAIGISRTNTIAATKCHDGTPLAKLNKQKKQSNLQFLFWGNVLGGRSWKAAVTPKPKASQYEQINKHRRDGFRVYVWF